MSEKRTQEDLLGDDFDEIAEDQRERAQYLLSLAEPSLPERSMEELAREARALRAASRRHTQLRENLSREARALRAAPEKKKRPKVNLEVRASPEKKRAKVTHEGGEEDAKDVPGEQSEKKVPMYKFRD